MDGLFGRVGRKVQDKDVGWRSWRRLTIISWLSDSDTLGVRLLHRSKSLSLVFERRFVTKSKYRFRVYSCFSTALMFQTIMVRICGSVSSLHIWFFVFRILKFKLGNRRKFCSWKVFHIRKYTFLNSVLILKSNYFTARCFIYLVYLVVT